MLNMVCAVLGFLLSNKLCMVIAENALFLLGFGSIHTPGGDILFPVFCQHIYFSNVIFPNMEGHNAPIVSTIKTDFMSFEIIVYF